MINIKIEYRKYPTVECFVFWKLIYEWVVWTLEHLFQETMLSEVIRGICQPTDIHLAHNVPKTWYLQYSGLKNLGRDCVLLGIELSSLTNHIISGISSIAKEKQDTCPSYFRCLLWALNTVHR